MSEKKYTDLDDVVKVIRCKDCKYALRSDVVFGIPDFKCLITSATCLSADDFCSYGKRKEQG